MLWAIACVSCNAGKLPNLRFKPLKFFICAWETYLLMLSTTMKSWLRHRVLVCRAYVGIFIWWSIYFGAFAQQWLNPLIKVIDSKTAKSRFFSKCSGFSVSYRVNSKNGWWNASKSMCFNKNASMYAQPKALLISLVRTEVIEHIHADSWSLMFLRNSA